LVSLGNRQTRLEQLMHMRRSSVALLVVLGLVTGFRVAIAREPLVIRVSPMVAQPPAFITVRADVEVNEDNRSLEVSAEGDDFFTSSRVPLEGRKAPRFSEVYFENVPAGSYRVKAVLFGSRGERATIIRTVTVGAPPDEDGLASSR
jgi:hypothetical protein